MNESDRNLEASLDLSAPQGSAEVVVGTPKTSGSVPVDGRIPNFDLLRIFVALEVVVIHLATAMDAPWNWFPISPVPAFVCLSGYLIPASFSSSRSWGHFAWKRMLRIMPPLLLSLVLVATIGGVAALGPTLLYYVTAGTIADCGLNLPLWSLIVEEVLYTYHCVSRILLKRWTIAMPIAALVVCEVLRHVGTPGIRWRQWQAANCFFAGNILYFYRDRLNRLNPRWLLLLLVYVARPAYAAQWKVVNPYLDVPVVVGFVILAYRLPQVRFRMPDLSYGIYVYHFPLIYLYVGWGFTGFALVTLAVVSTVGLSLFSWYAVESRALALKNVRMSDLSARRRRRALDAGTEVGVAKIRDGGS